MIGFLLLTSLVMSMAIMAVIEYSREIIPIPPLVVSAVDVVFPKSTAVRVHLDIMADDGAGMTKGAEVD